MFNTQTRKHYRLWRISNFRQHLKRSFNQSRPSPKRTHFPAPSACKRTHTVQCTSGQANSHIHNLYATNASTLLRNLFIYKNKQPFSENRYPQHGKRIRMKGEKNEEKPRRTYFSLIKQNHWKRTLSEPFKRAPTSNERLFVACTMYRPIDVYV